MTYGITLYILLSQEGRLLYVINQLISSAILHIFNLCILNFYVEILHLNSWDLENVCLYPQDYIEDNDSLVLLHDQIHECDVILSQIGSILSGFQVYTQPVYALLLSLSSMF